MNDIKQKINHAHALLASVQIAGAYAKLFGAAMQEIEDAYAGVERAEREEERHASPARSSRFESISSV